MALATRCPHCGKTFRVAADQLKLRGGIVRCGACQQIFDGNAALIDLAAKPSLAVAAPSEAAPAAVPTQVQTPAASVVPAQAETAAASVVPAQAGAQFPSNEAASDAEPHGAEDTATPLPDDAEAIYLDLGHAFDPLGILPKPAQEAEEPHEATGPQLAIMPGPASGPAQDAVTEPASEPVQAAVREPMPAPAPDTVPGPAHEPLPEPAPEIVPEPSHEPLPAPAPEIVPEPAHEPLRAPEPDIVPGPSPAPVPGTEPEPAPEPLPEPVPETVPQPVPETVPEPMPETAPEPEPLGPQAASANFAPHGRVEPTLGLSVDEELVAAPVHGHEHEDLQPLRAHASAASAEAAHDPLPMREAAGIEFASAAGPARPRVAEPRPGRRSKLKPTRIPPPKLRVAEIDEPEFVKRSRRQEESGRMRALLMAAGSVLLLVALAAQLSLGWRSDLAARFPATKPALAAACRLFGCRVDLPAKIDNLVIETGELTTLGANTYSLTTLLRNQGGLVQAWPDIELVLTDANDKPLLRRVFTPAEYLPRGAAPANGFAARAEQPVKLYFQLDQLKPSGYRIAVFYP